MEDCVEVCSSHWRGDRVFSAATLPAQAIVVCNVTSTNHVDPKLSPQCLPPKTKIKHPKWYRDGGFCAGGGHCDFLTHVSGSVPEGALALTRAVRGERLPGAEFGLNINGLSAHILGHE